MRIQLVDQLGTTQQHLPAARVQGHLTQRTTRRGKNHRLENAGSPSILGRAAPAGRFDSVLVGQGG